MSTLIHCSIGQTSLRTAIDTAVSRAQAALKEGKFEITATFEFEGVPFHIKIDSNPEYLISAFNNRTAGSTGVIGPYAAVEPPANHGLAAVDATAS
jgi:hypothetical protein